MPLIAGYHAQEDNDNSSVESVEVPGKSSLVKGRPEVKMVCHDMMDGLDWDGFWASPCQTRLTALHRSRSPTGSTSNAEDGER